MAQTGQRTLIPCMTRPARKYWFNADVTNDEQPPNLLNNEALLAINGTGLGTVALIKADGSNVVTLPEGATVPAGKTLTVAGALTVTGTVTLPESLIRYATVSISAADIVATAAGKFGHAAGVPLVADPGAGKLVELISTIMSYTFGVAAYTAGGNITVNINGGAAVTGLIAAASSIGAGASNIIQFVPLAAAGNVLTADKGINLVAAAAFTQPGGAVGTIKVFVAYRVHTL